ncbi:MAG TPA: hypothetical protein VND01_00590 [Candidatus Acidoferrales bacterium]|nr:hypothetical protein [Candidatus Acidoferrales bacterium]
MLYQKIYRISPLLNNKFLVLSILIFFAIWSFPASLYGANFGLDPSWVIAVHMAKIQHLTWGSDLVFTYGPLGYLLYPININHDTWSQAFFYTIISHILLFTILIIFVNKIKFPFFTVILFGILSIILVKLGHTYFPLLGMLLAFYLYLEYCKRKIILIPLAFFTAFLIYVKLDLGTASLSILVLSSAILIIKKRWKEAAVCGIAYASFLILIWELINNSLNHLQDYFIRSLMIVSDYPSAVSTNESPPFLLYMAVIGWILYFWWVFDSIKNKQNLKILLLSSPSLFLIFRLGFVRDVGHPTDFFLFWSLIFLVFVSTSFGKKIHKILKFSSLLLVIIFAATCVAYWSNLGTSFEFENAVTKLEKAVTNTEKAFFTLYNPEYVQSIPSYINYLVDDKSIESFRNGEKNNMKNYYDISKNALGMIGKQSVDIIEFDQAIAYAYDLNWHPKPILQSFNAYNAGLDNLDAEFLQKTNSTKFILYKNASIDGRYALFDEPATLITLLCDYQIKGATSDFLLLERNQDICGDEKIISDKTVRFGEEVTIPQVLDNDSYLFAKISIEHNLIGKISNVIYKPPQVYIHINGDNNKHRFIFKTAVNGILLSGSTELKSPLGILQDDIHTIKFTTDDENYYSQQIKIEFFQIHVVTNPLSSNNKLIIDNPIDVLLQLYYNRPDLQKAFPEAKNGDLQGLVEWARTVGVNDYQRFKLVSPMLDLLQTYYNRPDLQKAFPEVRSDHNLDNLMEWTLHNGIQEDPRLKSEARFFVNIRVNSIT